MPHLPFTLPLDIQPPTLNMHIPHQIRAHTHTRRRISPPPQPRPRIYGAVSRTLTISRRAGER